MYYNMIILSSLIYTEPPKSKTKIKLVRFLCRLHEAAAQSYPVRLTGGNNAYEGQVEVLHCANSLPSSCSWRTACGDGWDLNEASVTCRQLGLYGMHTCSQLFHTPACGILNKYICRFRHSTNSQHFNWYGFKCCVDYLLHK